MPPDKNSLRSNNLSGFSPFIHPAPAAVAREVWQLAGKYKRVPNAE